jgi:hypothetical protein
MSPPVGSTTNGRTGARLNTSQEPDCADDFTMAGGKGLVGDGNDFSAVLSLLGNAQCWQRISPPTIRTSVNPNRSDFSAAALADVVCVASQAAARLPAAAPVVGGVVFPSARNGTVAIGTRGKRRLRDRDCAL